MNSVAEVASMTYKQILLSLCIRVISPANVFSCYSVSLVSPIVYLYCVQDLLPHEFPHTLRIRHRRAE